MDDKIDAAMEKVLGMVRINMNPVEAMNITQAALNLAHVKQIQASINLSPKRKTSET